VASEVKSFGSFRLDTANHCLWRDSGRVSITPKAYDVLCHLVENSGRLVTPDEMLEAIWADTYVNPEVLRKYILEIRKALGDKSDAPQFVETVPKRGYRFIAAVCADTEPATSDAAEMIPISTIELTAPQSPPDDLQLAPPPSSGVTSLARSGKFGSVRGLLEAVVPAVVANDRDIGPKGGNGSAALGDQPEASPVNRRLSVLAIPAVLALLIVAILTSYMWRGQKGTKVSAQGSSAIAVLPFADLSPSQDQQYFIYGLSEQLINDLARMPDLKVVGRSSSFQFKDKNEDLRTIGKTLGVASVLEGSVSREGDRVRIRAELVKTEDGFQLWSETYVRPQDR